jgi:glycine C-acetyltransferase
MFAGVQQEITNELDEIRSAGLFKDERVIVSPQGPSIRVADGKEVLNLCANNYLGLADDPRIVAAAKEALDRWGYGLASVRFICGTQDVHKQLEERISAFLGTEDTILYSSCFDANGGLFETLLGEQDAVISDELNHASIIDGIRLSKARRLRYHNRDMADLENQLKASADARRRLIATDGVFSMDGYVAPLDEICDLAERHQAMVMVDDSHAVGFVDTRTARRDRPGRHRDRDAGKGAGRGQRWLHKRAQGDHRPAPPALTAVSLLEFCGTRGGGCLAEGARSPGEQR